jgi:hypothetical protein
MIISKKNKFVFLKTPKTGGSSLEFYLSQFCGKEDTLTPLLPSEEKIKKKLNLLNCRNYKIRKFNISNLSKFKISKKVVLNDHSSLKVLENDLRLNLNQYYIFALVRNPYDWIVSFFLWQLYFYKTFKVATINKLKKKEISLLFRLFLKTRCAGIFYEIKQIIFSKKYKVNIFKFEDFEKNITKFKKIFEFDDEKVKIDKINLKRLFINPNFQKKIKFSKEDINIVKREAKFIFDRYNYSKQIPKKYK